jgi:hypothetical protein
MQPERRRPNHNGTQLRRSGRSADLHTAAKDQGVPWCRSNDLRGRIASGLWSSCRGVSRISPLAGSKAQSGFGRMLCLRSSPSGLTGTTTQLRSVPARTACFVCGSCRCSAPCLSPSSGHPIDHPVHKIDLLLGNAMEFPPLDNLHPKAASVVPRGHARSRFSGTIPDRLRTGTIRVPRSSGPPGPRPRPLPGRCRGSSSCFRST